MNGILLVGVLLLVGAGCMVLLALYRPEEAVQEERLCPFAVLPVRDGSPCTEALLRQYAAQVAWMDAEVLRCVLLVYPPEDADAAELCREMVREYAVFAAASLPEALAMMEEKCSHT